MSPPTIDKPKTATVAKAQPLRGALLRKINYARCKTWDLLHGVDTCGEIPLSSIDFQSEHNLPGLEYQSHHPRILRKALSALDIRHEQYTFIDYGCGKGRVLMVAAEFPFRRIVGVEFVPQLAAVATENLKTYRGARLCRDLSVLAMDATEYRLPSEPEVLFFYSPFTGNVMEHVVSNIEASLQESPRNLFVLFSGMPVMRDRAFGTRPHYKRLTRERYFDLFQHVS